MQARPVPDDRDGIQALVTRDRAQDLVRRVVGLEFLARNGRGPTRLFQDLRRPSRADEGLLNTEPTSGRSRRIPLAARRNRSSPFSVSGRFASSGHRSASRL